VGARAVIEAVAAANPNTIVVLETGNPVVMPWRDRVNAILEAWYPGQAGGQAIAEILTGAVNPSGRLPVTFPADLAQTPRPELPGLGTPWGTSVTIHYSEGAEIGYRWFAKTRQQPLYPFGHGLSYTSFAYNDLKVTGDDTITATFTVANTRDRSGADAPQLYLTDCPGDPRKRLLGFDKVELGPGESREITITADPRLLARYDGKAGQWHIAGGVYTIAIGKAADAPELTAKARIEEQRFGR
jgi:beta-glucosidase